MAYAEIGKNIRAARKQLNKSREELAEKSGLSAKFIGNIERGEKAVSLDSFVCIANVLGVSADMLLGSVLTNGYKVKTSVLCDQINALPPKKREKVIELIQVLLKDET